MCADACFSEICSLEQVIDDRNRAEWDRGESRFRTPSPSAHHTKTSAPCNSSQHRLAIGDKTR